MVTTILLRGPSQKGSILVEPDVGKLLSIEGCDLLHILRVQLWKLQKNGGGRQNSRENTRSKSAFYAARSCSAWQGRCLGKDPIRERSVWESRRTSPPVFLPLGPGSRGRALRITIKHPLSSLREELLPVGQCAVMWIPFSLQKSSTSC